MTLPHAGRRIRVLITDDHPIFRDGLRRLLESEDGFEVVGEAKDGSEAIRMAQALHPDVILLDVAMPRVTGLAALEELGKMSTKVILLTAAIERADIVTALQLGARGVIMKDAATEQLFKGIRAVMGGQYWVGREGVSDLILMLKQMMAAEESEPKKTWGLTKRELEIIGTIVAGYPNKDIAKKFVISEDTVKHHLTNIFNKVGVSTRLELALFAVHHKLIKEF
jgi:DNA-binding NarL/FixJ family response regulator